MKTIAFEGPAGCGKTYQLMEKLKLILRETPLHDRQSVLALTFMHGSRRRLTDRLKDIPELQKKFQCLTIDSFAQRICSRWRSLSRAIGLPVCGEEEFDRQCHNAGQLLANEYVKRWVVSSFPITIIDEAQDLSIERLTIIQQLQKDGVLLAAADEFQCLIEELKPNPFSTWLPKVCTPEYLTIPKRTSVVALLKAAESIRNGKPPVSGQNFKIQLAAAVPLAAAFISNQIGWNGGKDFALICPTTKGGYATGIVDAVLKKATKQGNGPYVFHWERPDLDYVSELLTSSDTSSTYTIKDAVAFVKSLKMEQGAIRLTVSWLFKEQNIVGASEISLVELKGVLTRSVTLQRQRFGGFQHRHTALNIHQAKNREFDGVIVTWPHTAGGSDDHKRRLLYNAVTRAKKWCLVLVQSENLLTTVPFT
jgi:hypothetical protein